MCQETTYFLGQDTAMPCIRGQTYIYRYPMCWQALFYITIFLMKSVP